MISRHHQALSEPGANWAVSGVDDEGLIEAIERGDHPFALGVQWHPELDEPGTTASERLFKAFEEIGLPSYTPLLRQCDADGTLTLLKGLEEFREHLGGELNVTLPDGLGRGIEVHAIDHARMIEAIGLLEARRADAA